MDKGNNPTIMRFNRNAFVESDKTQPLAAASPDTTIKPTTAPGSAEASRTPATPKAAPSPPPVRATSIPSSYFAEDAPFDAASRLAELRGEAMKTVNKTVMSQLGLKRQVETNAAVVPIAAPRKPRPVAQIAPKPAPVIPEALLKDLPDKLFTDDATAKPGLSLAAAPAPRRRQDIPRQDASRILAKQAQRLSSLKKQNPTPVPKIAIPSVAVAPPPKASPSPVHASVSAPGLTKTNLVSTPLAKKPNLANLAKKINNDDVPVKDYKSVVKHDKIKKRAGKITKKQKLIGIFGSVAVTLGVGAYIFYLSVPDLAVRIAASQAGIDVAYPSTTIPGFAMSDVSSNASGEITINYTNRADTYTITQKRSSWDSDALLHNFVMPTWGGTYTVVREKGLTIYISSGRAAWVSGGIQFIIDATDANFSNDQLRTIALSM